MIDPQSYIGQILHGTLLLLAIVNPLGNIPVYVSLTKRMDEGTRTKMLTRAVIIAFAMVALFAVIGDWGLRNVFEVTIDEFKVAGGILLFIIAAQGVLLSAQSYNLSPDEEHFMAIFPLAFPIIVGPGSLALTIILAERFGRPKMLVITLLAMAVTFAFARSSYAVMRIVGPFAGQVIARLLYLFLAAKAVSMVLVGLSGYFHPVVAH